MDGYFQAEDSLLVQRAFMGATVLVVERLVVDGAAGRFPGKDGGRGPAR